MSSAVSLPNHTFTWQAESSKRLTSELCTFLHQKLTTALLESAKAERITVENISWLISTKECCRPGEVRTRNLLITSRMCIQLSHRGRPDSPECIMGSQVCKVSSCGQQRVQSDCVHVQISLHIHEVWSDSSLSAWRIFASLAIKIAPIEDFDQTARMSGRYETSPCAHFWEYVFWCCDNWCINAMHHFTCSFNC